MSNRLEEIKQGQHENYNFPHDGCREKIEWLIAEVESLTKERDELLIGGAKQAIFTIKQLEAENAELSKTKEHHLAMIGGMDKAIDDFNQKLAASEKARDECERQYQEKVADIGVILDEKQKLEAGREKRIDKWAEIVENLEAKNVELKEAKEGANSECKYWRIHAEDMEKKLAASENEVKSVVTEINSIKSERNAVIKAHADLLSECQKLKTQLKFLEVKQPKWNRLVVCVKCGVEHFSESLHTCFDPAQESGRI